MLRRMARRKREPERDLSGVILDATRRLLERRRFAELTVADILAEAAISRGSFYFYFEGKHDVLAELVRRAIAAGQQASTTWLDHEGEPDRRTATRWSIEAGARLWSDQAAVLRAVVENWRDDPKLAELWQSLMNAFTDSTAARIDADRASGAITHHDVDSRTLAAGLTWLGERLYYLAAIGVEPFEDREELIDVLTHFWLTTLYADAPR
jgi:AcrR family transcriptional regulator